MPSTEIVELRMDPAFDDRVVHRFLGVYHLFDMHMKEKNQCEGCKKGMLTTLNGIWHINLRGGLDMSCTKDRYISPTTHEGKIPECIDYQGEIRICYCGKCKVNGYPLPADYPKKSQGIETVGYLQEVLPPVKEIGINWPKEEAQGTPSEFPSTSSDWKDGLCDCEEGSWQGNGHSEKCRINSIDWKQKEREAFDEWRINYEKDHMFQSPSYYSILAYMFPRIETLIQAAQKDTNAVFNFQSGYEKGRTAEREEQNRIHNSGRKLYQEGEKWMFKRINKEWLSLNLPLDQISKGIDVELTGFSVFMQKILQEIKSREGETE